MATYEELYGKRVKEFDSDPTLESSYEGQVWYDKSSGTLRSVVSFGAWRSGGNLTVPRSLGGISGGTQTASLAYAGYLGGPGNSNSTEEYNGTGWGSGGNVNTARRGGAGLGIQTAALLAGGYSTTPTTFVEEYNGSSWSEVTNTPADMSAGAGTQTAALTFNGTTALYYDGTNWTSSTALPTAMVGGTGLQTAALAVIPPPSGTTTLEWDGSAWTTGGSYNTARPSGLGGMTSGIQTSAISAGTPSSPPPTRVGPITEQYDGTSWATSSGTQGTARHTYMTSAANNTAALIAGGSPYTTATEEFNQSINTITAAAWASSGALNTARWGSAAMGTQTAGLLAGGATSPKVNNSEEYDGTSWTEGDNLNTGRGLMAAGTNSTQTAGLAFGGTTSTGPDNSGITNATEEYNGSSWTSVNNMNYSSRNFGGAGTQTSALAMGGIPVLATTGEYDGTNWTAGTSLPSGRQDNQGAAGASQTAVILAGGEIPPGSRTDETLEYDGTNWTTGGTLPTAVYSNTVSGIQTAALSFGGYVGSRTTETVGYDGTSWSTRPSMASARQYAKGAGTNVATYVAGGIGPPGGAIADTEEFTGETETVTASTLTSS